VIISAHQPHYLPWLPYVEKIFLVDVHVVLDDVEFHNGDWQNRNRVSGPNGPVLLTVPVRRRKGILVRDVEVVHDGWEERHARTIAQSYARAPYFGEHWPSLALVYERRLDRLVDVALETVCFVKSAMGIGVPCVLSSALGIRTRGNERLVDICRALGATTYLSGVGAKAYLDIEAFRAAGIFVRFQEWCAPGWLGSSAEHAAVDAIFRHGPKAREAFTGASAMESRHA